MVKYFTFLLFFFFITSTYFGSTSGKITGYVKDKDTGEPLIGANIIIEESQIGAATNADGYFVILNVPPGTYRLKVSYIGYATLIIKNVKVLIDLTTSVDAKLSAEIVQGEQVVVVAQKPIVMRYVSYSQMNLNPSQIQNLPVHTID